MIRPSYAHVRPARTQADKFNDCLMFIVQARPSALLAMTPKRLCEFYGVTVAAKRDDVARRLGEAQERERSKSVG